MCCCHALLTCVVPYRTVPQDMVEAASMLYDKCDGDMIRVQVPCLPHRLLLSPLLLPLALAVLLPSLSSLALAVLLLLPGVRPWCVCVCTCRQLPAVLHSRPPMAEPPPSHPRCAALAVCTPNPAGLPFLPVSWT